jgi:hypothetical protein
MKRKETCDGNNYKLYIKQVSIQYMHLATYSGSISGNVLWCLEYDQLSSNILVKSRVFRVVRQYSSSINHPMFRKNIVMDLINALPGNSTVNTVQHATTEEAVFSVNPTYMPVDWLDSDHVICVYCGSMSVPQLCKWENSFKAVTIVVAAEAHEQASKQ